MAMTIARFVAYRLEVSTLGKSTVASYSNIESDNGFSVNGNIPEGITWSNLEVTTAFIVANVPPTKALLQVYGAALTKVVSRGFSTSSSSTSSSSRKTSNGTNSALEQPNQNSIPPPETVDYEGARLRILRLDSQGRPRLASLASTFIA